MRQQRKINNFYVFYRISDNGNKNKDKLDCATKINCLKNALITFSSAKIIVFVDAIIEATNNAIHELCGSLDNVEIKYLDCKSNPKSFRAVYEEALKLNDDDFVYFLEDDYLHLDGSFELMKESAERNYTDYITLYDHPDKYEEGCEIVNPYCNNFGENTFVFRTPNRHWKITNSTTMTVGAFVDILRRDKDVFWKYTSTNASQDFEIFTELRKENKFLSSPIPSLSTHCEKKFLAPFIKWEKDAKFENDCCIVIITHKERLEGDEERSFKRAFEVFGGKRDIKLIVPKKISLEYYSKFNDITEIAKLDDKWFESVKTYNHLLCTSEFYDMFAKYEYILIYQTDCWVYEDRLDEFMDKGYDYYGAPWKLEGLTWSKNSVGNGGFSLRKVSAMRRVCINNEYNFDKGEDLWFCILHKDEINICDLETACNFSIEMLTDEFKKKIATFPMGLHGTLMKEHWGYKDFWIC